MEQNKRYWSGKLTLENFEFVAERIREQLVGNRWSFAISNNYYAQPNIELRTSCRLYEHDSEPLKISLEAESGHISVHEMDSQGGCSWGLHTHNTESDPFIRFEPGTIKIYQKNGAGDDLVWLIMLEEKPDESE